MRHPPPSSERVRYAFSISLSGRPRRAILGIASISTYLFLADWCSLDPIRCGHPTVTALRSDDLHRQTRQHQLKLKAPV
ncbi:hypothetical protein PCASD_16914 [Puccinia coronata f. sp. avenae]|uniref:Uncharacterized protein n=1 Tax=Puccinia coronata f. sp. avenae TaxID=200324 RepID=A0A2N5T540_9BASI|nr:hypothetical protein PCASD_16914 [Puccinia coronata f. sp. avenae]